MKLGKAFSDSLIIEHKKETRFARDTNSAWWMGAGRLLIFTVVLTVIIFVLIFRLFQLTVIHGHRYRILADENRTRELIRHAPRGLLLDRTGKPLVTNTARYRLIKPCAKGNIAVSDGACVTYISKKEGDTMINKGLAPGYFLEVDYERNYPDGPAFAHMLGYTGELSQNELKEEYYMLRGYGRGDRIGRSGAEEVYEDRLRGRDGKEMVEVDAVGTILRTLGRDKEVPGNDITLSLDADVSRIVSDAYPEGFNGAVIVSKPTTGEILALYSSPTYDPNMLSGSISQKDYDALFNDTKLPLFNRAIGGVYPPGSTFKIITALAGLETKIVTKDTKIEDTGVLTVGQFSFSNWYFSQYGKTDGMVNITRAIAHSNDIYFYQLGKMIGIEKLATYAKKVGIGKPLGIELGGEASGLMPDTAWKNSHFQSPANLLARDNLWYDGDTYHVSIGQGYLLTTPLQVNTWTNLIANNGKLCRPTIEKATGANTKRCLDLSITPSTVRTITQGMEQACSPEGTAYPLFNFGIQKFIPDPKQPDATPSATFIKIPLACKTGTAEFGDLSQKTHAWFTVFAPVPQTADGNPLPVDPIPTEIRGMPEISVTVLVENAGEGSEIAAPVAKKILEKWFAR